MAGGVAPDGEAFLFVSVVASAVGAAVVGVGSAAFGVVVAVVDLAALVVWVCAALAKLS